MPSSFASLTEKKLPKAPERWGSFVLNELKGWGQLPPDVSTDFQFIERGDEGKGAALATVVIGIGETVVNVPVVIRDGKLQPMDIMEVDGEFMPFTASRISRYNIASTPFSDVTVPPSSVKDYGQNIARLVVPPLRQGGMVKTWSDKTADISEMLVPKLVRSFTKPELNARLMPLDNRAYANYKKHGTFDVLLGVIKGPDGSTKGIAQAYGDDVAARGEINVLWVRRPSDADASDGFGTVLGASGRAFDPALIRMPVKDMIKFYGNESGIDPLNQTQVFIQQGYADGVPIADVDHNGEAGHDIGVRELNLGTLDPHRNLAVISGTTGHGTGAGFHTVTPRNVIHCLYNTPSMTKRTSAMLDEKNQLIVGDKFYGVYTPRSKEDNTPWQGIGRDEDSSINKISESPYIFACKKADGAYAFGPMWLENRITSPLSVAGSNSILTQFDGTFNGAPVMVQRSALFQEASVDHSSGMTKIMLPEDYRLVCIAQDIHSSPATPAEVGFIAKIAHSQAADWLKAWTIDGGATVSLDLPAHIKSAYQEVLDRASTGLNLDRLEPKTAEFVLIAAGVQADDAREFIKEAMAEPITAYGLTFLPANLPQELSPEKKIKLAALRRGFADWISKEAEKAEVFKLAAGIDGPQNVDAILGLGLSSEKNVDLLLESLPKYEAALKSLSVMLKDARLHGAPVDEAVLQKAVIALENFVEQGKAHMASVNQIQSPGAIGMQPSQIGA